MADFPYLLYDPRQKENWPGMVFDNNKKTIIFKEDFDAIKYEIRAIEQALGLNLSNIFGEWQSFAWRTLFESLDGFIKSGIGSIDEPGEEIDIISGNISGNEKKLEKWIEINPVAFSWNKNRRFRTAIITSEITNSDKFILTGKLGTNRSFGFWIYNNNLYARVCNGSGVSTLGCGTIQADELYKLEAIFTAGVSVKFYVNGVYKGELTMNLPFGDSSADYLFSASVKTNENASKTLSLSSFEFEQKL